MGLSKMPYNKSKACVRRNLSFLNTMKEARKTITFPAKNPRKFAARLREAMDTATRHPEFESLHFIKDNFRIRVKSGWVEAEWIGVDSEASEVSSPGAMVVAEAINVQGVVGACIMFQTKSDELHFPNAVVSAMDKVALYNWGRSEEHGPHWKLISHGEKGITMTRKSGVSEIFFWEPRGVE